jgi:hypothetical protein
LLYSADKGAGQQNPLRLDGIVVVTAAAACSRGTEPMPGVVGKVRDGNISNSEVV